MRARFWRLPELSQERAGTRVDLNEISDHHPNLETWKIKGKATLTDLTTTGTNVKVALGYSPSINAVLTFSKVSASTGLSSRWRTDTIVEAFASQRVVNLH